MYRSCNEAKQKINVSVRKFRTIFWGDFHFKVYRFNTTQNLTKIIYTETSWFSCYNLKHRSDSTQRHGEAGTPKMISKVCPWMWRPGDEGFWACVVMMWLSVSPRMVALGQQCFLAFAVVAN